MVYDAITHLRFSVCWVFSCCLVIHVYIAHSVCSYIPHGCFPALLPPLGWSCSFISISGTPWVRLSTAALLGLHPLRNTSRGLAIEAVLFATSRNRTLLGAKARGLGSSRIPGWIEGDVCRVSPRATKYFEKGILVGSVLKASKNGRTVSYMTGGPTMIEPQRSGPWQFT